MIDGPAPSENPEPVIEPAAKPLNRQVAVIDIGSNSVRLVVYRLRGRAIIPRINEKVLAGLGARLARTGKLDPDGVSASLKAIARYSAICAALGITEIKAFATAAVRDADDGPDFHARAEQTGGFPIRVLSGEDEARMAALGVLSAGHKPTGLIGDLGGSSLELVACKDGTLEAGTSFSLGPLALMQKFETPNKAMLSWIGKRLQDGNAELEPEGAFYAVGGAWRTLARVHMTETGYPLQVLQAYQVPADQMIELCGRAMSPKDDLLALFKKVSSKRAPTLPYAAALLKVILETYKTRCGRHVLYRGQGRYCLRRNVQQFAAGRPAARRRCGNCPAGPATTGFCRRAGPVLVGRDGNTPPGFRRGDRPKAAAHSLSVC